MANIFKIAMVFIGTVIGAGFASGQEMIQFFVKYGAVSLWGVVISGLLFGLTCGVVLCKIHATGADSVDAYFANLHRPWLIRAIHLVVRLFMLASFCVMVAASGALFQEQLGLSPWLGVLCMCAICLAAFWKGTDGLVGINALLTPLMIVGILLLGAYLFLSDVAAFSPCMLWDNFLVSSILYVSYNTLTLVVVMTTLQPQVTDRKTAVGASVVGGGVLCLMAMVLWGILYVTDVGAAELPMLEAAGGIHSLAKVLYLPILYSAIVTTAVANGYGVIHHGGKHPKGIAVGICLLAALVSVAKFSDLVARVYTAFGYLGVGIMVLTMVDGVLYLKNGKKQRK